MTAWGIGLSDRETRSQPVFLILLPDAQRLAAVMNLLLSVSGAFVIVAPTPPRSVECRIACDPGVTFIALGGTWWDGPVGTSTGDR